MAEKQHRMSRRAILAAAGMTPAMLLAIGVSEEMTAQVALAATATPSGTDVEKYGKVCERLWSAFVKGAGTTPIGPNVFNVAVNTASAKIVTNLAKFPDDGEDINTMFCSLRAGVKAAAKAGGGTISDQNFSDAYKEVHDEQGSLAAKLGMGQGDFGLAC